MVGLAFALRISHHGKESHYVPHGSKNDANGVARNDEVPDFREWGQGYFRIGITVAVRQVQTGGTVEKVKSHIRKVIIESCIDGG